MEQQFFKIYVAEDYNRTRCRNNDSSIDSRFFRNDIPIILASQEYSNLDFTEKENTYVGDSFNLKELSADIGMPVVIYYEPVLDVLYNKERLETISDSFNLALINNHEHCRSNLSTKVVDPEIKKTGKDNILIIDSHVNIWISIHKKGESFFTSLHFNGT